RKHVTEHRCARDRVQHLRRRRPHAGALTRGQHNNGELLVGHVNILSQVAGTVTRGSRPPSSGRLDGRSVWGTARAALIAVRLGVTAARQPLELLGPGSNPGGGATPAIMGGCPPPRVTK